MWSPTALSAVLVILFVALIALAYFSQTTPDHPALSTVQLMLPHHVKLTPEHELLTQEEPFLLQNLRIPATVNLYSRAGSSKIPTDDQGKYGSCTAHALRYAWNLWKMRQNPNANLVLPSRCFWYAESRLRLGFSPPLDDLGSTNEATMWVLANKGSIPESSYPYNAQNMSRETPAETLRGGASGRSSIAIPFLFHVSTTNNINALKRILAQGNSIVVAIMVYSSFMTNAVFKSGIIPLPNTRREALLGGHAICITGYNTSFFTFRNSWGSKVGSKGMFQIPQSYIGNWNLCGDAWII